MSFSSKRFLTVIPSDCKRSIPLHKKWSFPSRISSVNVTKSVGNYGFGHIYWRILWWKTSFFVQCSHFVMMCTISVDVMCGRVTIIRILLLHVRIVEIRAENNKHFQNFEWVLLRLYAPLISASTRKMGETLIYLLI